MQRKSLTIAIICLALPLASCHPPRSSLDQDRKAVLTAEREWAAAARDRDLDRSVSYMADDATMFPPGGRACCREGRDSGLHGFRLRNSGVQRHLGT